MLQQETMDVDSDEEPIASSRGCVERQLETSPPWVEKYRPKNVSDVVFQEEVVSVLKKCLDGGDFSHLLFYGPPGTGKTSTILALAHQMFGAYVKDRVLELNSSDERGIDVIRNKVKNFASSKVTSKLPDGRSCLPIRIVILDEADSMTPFAQSALRRIIESTTESTRFCLICNYITRIIEPLTSRCSKFRFKPLTQEIAINKLREIAANERITIKDENTSKDPLQEIIRISDGDLRKAITFLQSVHRLKANHSSAVELSFEDVQEVSGVITEQHLKVVMDCVKSKEFMKLEKSVTSLIANGYAASQLFTQLLPIIMNDSDLSDLQKCYLLKKMATADHRLLEGASEYLQIFDVLAAYFRTKSDPAGDTILKSYRVE